jgi:hypothetical protein
MTDPALLQWFDRSCGQWRSERTYLFKPDGKFVIITTMIDVDRGDHHNEYVIKWTGKTTGEMRVSVVENKLVRSRDYFGNEAHDSDLSMLDPDTVVLRTTYDGVTYCEEISLRSHDQYRLRRNFGTHEDGSFALFGSYMEFRLPAQANA